MLLLYCHAAVPLLPLLLPFSSTCDLITWLTFVISCITTATLILQICSWEAGIWYPKAAILYVTLELNDITE